MYHRESNIKYEVDCVHTDVNMYHRESNIRYEVDCVHTDVNMYHFMC